jgi:fumarylacetoacetase
VPALPVPDGSPFPLTNLPYGVGGRPGEPARVLVAAGDQALDLTALAGLGLLGEIPAETLAAPALNPLFALGSGAWRTLRDRLRELVTGGTATDQLAPALRPLAEVELRLPFEVADYVDFYSSLDHATTVGRIFRPLGDPLAPNWRWLPVGYHGRAGTVVVSGTPVVRPRGQSRPADESAPPPVGPSAQLDVEVEVGFVVGTPSARGTGVPMSAFRDHVFGVVLLNDWSARDIQGWESHPLGPFLGKSFLTTISPWVVPLDALEAARVAPPTQDPQPPDYLRDKDNWGLDIDLTLSINDCVVSRPRFASMYWTMPQQLAHATVNGATLRTGDLFASGTVSGTAADERGCLLELTWGGRDHIELSDGTTRSYLEDGDGVVIRATAPGLDGTRIGFGDCGGRVVPNPSSVSVAGGT